MDNPGLFIILVVVIILVIGLVVILFWPKNSSCGDHSASDQSMLIGAGDRLDPVGASYPDTFEGLHKLLGQKLFDLVDAVGTPSQGQIRADISILIEKMGKMSCSADHAQKFIDLHNRKVDVLVSYVATAHQGDFYSGKEEHTPTGSHTDNSGFCGSYERELKKLAVELSLLSEQLAQAYKACAQVPVDELKKLLDMYDSTLIEYNKLANLDHKSSKAKAFKESHLALWCKIRMD